MATKGDRRVAWATQTCGVLHARDVGVLACPRESGIGICFFMMRGQEKRERRDQSGSDEVYARLEAVQSLAPCAKRPGATDHANSSSNFGVLYSLGIVAHCSQGCC